MKERKGTFKGFSIENCWLPLTDIVIKASNMAIHLDDESYCKFIALQHDLLLRLYVDAGKMPVDIYNRFFYVFIYVLEFVYGDPYSSGNTIHRHDISVYDVFVNIKKHWNDNISEKLAAASKKVNK